VEGLSEILIDTGALVRYLDDSLPSKADERFAGGEQGRHRLLLPQIPLGEFVSIALRGKVRSAHSRTAVAETLEHILSSDLIMVSSMPACGWEIFPLLEIPGLHDRRIASEAIARELPLVSNDPAFEGIPGLDLIWREGAGPRRARRAGRLEPRSPPVPRSRGS
jgi:predicted nucleic acid-binding protein